MARARARVEQHLHLVTDVAWRFLRKNAWAHPYDEDVEGACRLALVEAAENWPGSDAGPFDRWARTVMYRAAIDHAGALHETEHKKGQPRRARDIVPIDPPWDDGEESDATPAEYMRPYQDHRTMEYLEGDALVQASRPRVLAYLESKLTEPEFWAITHYAGLAGEEPRDQKELAEAAGVSRSAISNRLLRAYDKLRTDPRTRAYLT